MTLTEDSVTSRKEKTMPETRYTIFCDFAITIRASAYTTTYTFTAS